MILAAKQAFKYLYLLFLLVGFTNTSYGYDSLSQALLFHQSSNFNKALPIFINLSKKYKRQDDVAKYSLSQIKLADIVRNYGGANVAIEMLNTNEKLLNIRHEKESIELAQNYLAKAEAYYSANRLAEFKQSIQHSIRIKNQLKLPEKYLTEDYLQLARYYKEFRNLSDSCLYWMNKALRMAKSDKSQSAYLLPRIYNLFGYYYHPPSISNYLNQRELFYTHLKVSRRYYDSALASIQSQRPQDQLMFGKIYHNLGNSYNNEFSENGKPETLEKALSYYKKSLDLFEPLGSPTELANKDWVIGKAYERASQSDAAITMFTRGMKRLMPSYHENNEGGLPDLQPTLNDSWFISLISIKAYNLLFKYRTSQDVVDLKAAYHHFIYLQNFHRYLLSQSLNENESINWNYLYASNSYQILLKVAFDLSVKTDDFSYVRKIYPLVASSKYAWINKADIDYAKLNAINSSTLKEEFKLVKKQLTKIIPDIREQDLSLILPKSAEVLEKPSSFINLANQVLDTLSLPIIEKKLGTEKSALLDFYISGPELYTVVGTKDSLLIYKSMLSDDFRGNVYTLNKSLSVLSPAGYASLAYKVYHETLDSALTHIPKGINRLIICPDGNLSNIPWDALVNDTSNSNTFKELKYLINQYAIRTVLSPKHLAMPSRTSDGFYGVASEFKGSTKFSSIPFSNALIKEKADQLNGVFSTTLLQDTGSINIFHVATHVVPDSLRPYRSTMYFNDADSITLSDFSKLKIRPRLAILNGCQTGTGTYYQSEGTMSFARAFYRLEAESVLMTLWSVDDKTTADVLKLFYGKMENGEDLDLAVQESKLAYIKNVNSDELANPYYWAGIQLSGKADPVIVQSYRWWIVVMSFALVALAVVVYTKRERITKPLLKRM